eukprot:4622309-Amphidinium_carterae.1
MVLSGKKSGKFYTRTGHIGIAARGPHSVSGCRRRHVQDDTAQDKSGTESNIHNMLSKTLTIIAAFHIFGVGVPISLFKAIRSINNHAIERPKPNSPINSSS